MAALVLVRHGRTVWGEEDRFTGWGDTPLHESGFKEAATAGNSLKKLKIRFDLCFASRLIRSKQTLDVIADALGAAAGEIREDWRLNERHYGALQGESRQDMTRRYDEVRISEWRRSFHGRPPALAEDDPRLAEQFGRFPDIAPAIQPRTESMADGAARSLPVWTEEIAPALREGRNVLVVAHTSPIRGIVRAIKSLTDEECGAYRIANAVPQRFDFDEGLTLQGSAFLTGGIGGMIRLYGKSRPAPPPRARP